MDLGISEQDWNSLTPHEVKLLAARHQKRLKMQAEAADYRLAVLLCAIMNRFRTKKERRWRVSDFLKKDEPAKKQRRQQTPEQQMKIMEGIAASFARKGKK